MSPTTDAPALLISELFPPDVGGSAVLFGNVYGRFDAAVSVLTERGEPARRTFSPLTVVDAHIATPHWGLLNWQGFKHHASLAREITRWVRRTGAIVHCGRAMPEGVAAWMARLAHGAKYLCWAHGEDVASAWSSRELTWVAERVYRSAVAIVANSRNTASLVEKCGVPRARIHVVYPGVDSTRFRPDLAAARLRRRFASDSEVLLLSVGRLQRRKGHDLAVAAVARVCRDTNVKYVIVGDGEDRTRLENLVRDHGVADRVFFAGNVEADDLPLYYAACDVFLLPNRVHDGDIEGFGIVFLEAAATGRPAIGGNSGGVPEAVVNGLTGLLVSGKNVEELESRLRLLITNPLLRHRLGEAGRRRVVNDFTWNRAARHVLSIHQTVSHGTLHDEQDQLAAEPSVASIDSTREGKPCAVSPASLR